MFEKSSTASRAATLSAIFFAVVIAWGVFGFGLTRVKWLANWSERGQFGDMFGALNTLFSGFAFGGVIYALVLQINGLRLQQIEVEQSAEALAQQIRLSALSAALSAHAALLQSYPPGSASSTESIATIRKLLIQIDSHNKV